MSALETCWPSRRSYKSWAIVASREIDVPVKPERWHLCPTPLGVKKPSRCKILKFSFQRRQRARACPAMFHPPLLFFSTWLDSFESLFLVPSTQEKRGQQGGEPGEGLQQLPGRKRDLLGAGPSEIFLLPIPLLVFSLLSLHFI